MIPDLRSRLLFMALTLILLFSAACSTALPPVIRGPETPGATEPPAEPTQPEVAPTIEATAVVTTTVEATSVVTATVEVSPVITETAVVEPTPAITAITGQVVYRQRIALAPDAVVEVLLQDTSRADAPAVTVGSQTIETQGAQVPIPFTVEYDLSQIDPAGLYTLRATIKEGGALAWSSTTVIPVITRGAPTDQIEIMVEPVSSQPKAEMGTLEGVVTYLQRIALPDNAVVEVTLADVSRQDAPAAVIAQQTIETNGKQVPIAFSLEYDPAKIDPRMTYAVSARITVDGKLAWISDTINPVLTRDAPVNNVEIIVRPVAS